MSPLKGIRTGSPARAQGLRASSCRFLESFGRGRKTLCRPEMASRLWCSAGCLMTQSSRRPGSPSGSYVRSSSSVISDGFLSSSRIGWSAGCRMYLQPDSAKAARYAVRIQETRARSGKYRSCWVTVKLRPVLWVSLSVRRGIHPSPLADHGHSRIGAVECTQTWRMGGGAHPGAGLWLEIRQLAGLGLGGALGRPAPSLWPCLRAAPRLRPAGQAVIRRSDLTAVVATWSSNAGSSSSWSARAWPPADSSNAQRA
jgi:hypothetical protein